jgi:hypothetical protein
MEKIALLLTEEIEERPTLGQFELEQYGGPDMLLQQLIL